MSMKLDGGQISKSSPFLLPCSRKRLGAALKRRRVLGSSPVSVGTFLFLVVTASLLLSATVWADYDPWNIPSVISGFFAAALAWPVVVWAGWLSKNSIGPNMSGSVSGRVRSQIRKGNASIVFLIFSLLFLLSWIVLPRRDLLWEFHKVIGIGNPWELETALDFYNARIAKSPKYIGDPGAGVLLATIEAIELDKQNAASDKWEAILKRTTKIKNDNRAYIRERSEYLVALYYANKPDASAAMSRLGALNLASSDPIIRHLACQRMGYICQTSGQSLMAQKHYLFALRYAASSKILENLAISFEDEKYFQLAEVYFREAELVFSDESKDRFHPRSATHYLNIASFYNNYANHIENLAAASLDDKVRVKLREQQRELSGNALRFVRQAVTDNPEQLDIYWVGSSIAYNAGDINSAILFLDDAEALLDNKSQKAISALAKHDFSSIGPFYTAWLRVKMLYERSPDSKAFAASFTQLSSRVSGFSNAPYERIKAWVERVHRSGFVDEEDFKTLDVLKSKGLLDPDSGL